MRELGGEGGGVVVNAERELTDLPVVGYGTNKNSEPAEKLSCKGTGGVRRSPLGEGQGTLCGEGASATIEEVERAVLIGQNTAGHFENCTRPGNPPHSSSSEGPGALGQRAAERSLLCNCEY